MTAPTKPKEDRDPKRLNIFNPYKVGQVVTIVTANPIKARITATTLCRCAVAIVERPTFTVHYEDKKRGEWDITYKGAQAVRWVTVADLNAWGNKPAGRVYKPAPDPIMLPAISSAPPARGDLIRERETGKLYIVANANPAIVWKLMPGRGIVDAAFTELFLMQGRWQRWYEIVQRAVWEPDAKQERDIHRRVHDDLFQPVKLWQTYTYMDVKDQPRTVRRLEDIA